MNIKHVRWLYSELQEWIDKGILTPEIAARIRGHYGSIEHGSGRRMAFTVCAILGSLLIGTGVILLLAHNWAFLGRATRTVLAMAPLTVSLGLAGWILASGRLSAAWRESTGTLNTLAVAAAMALVGQTYHVSGDTDAFILSWMLLSLPVLYLLRSHAAAIVYMIGVTVWAGWQLGHDTHPILYWPLIALIVPHLIIEGRKDRYSPAFAALGWVFSLALCAGVGFSLEYSFRGLWIIIYSALLPLLYLAGLRWFADADGNARRPFLTVGAIGTCVMALILSFGDIWSHIHGFHGTYAITGTAATAVDWTLAIALPVAAIALFVNAFRRGDSLDLMVGLMPPLSVLSFILAVGFDLGVVGMVAFNVYLFALGIRMIVSGARSVRLAHVNGGLALITAFIVARFFDTDLGFTVRGLAFILIGIGFIATNVIMLRRAKGGRPS